jgi:hypothetical protein
MTGQITVIPATQGLLSALSAACQLLHDAPDEARSVSVAGRLEPGATALPLLARAESLAREFGFEVLMRLGAAGYEIRFWRAAEMHE